MAPTNRAPRSQRPHSNILDPRARVQVVRNANRTIHLAHLDQTASPTTFTFTSQPPAPNPQAAPSNNHPNPSQPPAPRQPPNPSNGGAHFIPPEQTLNNIPIPNSHDLLEQAKSQVEAANAEEAVTPQILSAQSEWHYRDKLQKRSRDVTMANNNNTPEFSFGQPTSSGGASSSASGTAGADQAKSPFAAPASTGGNLFGGASAGGAGSLFGNLAQQTPTFGGFGSKAPASTGATSSVFSQPTTSAGQEKTLFGAVTGGTGGIFGGNTGSSGFNLGGAKPASPAPGASSSQPPAAGSLFGNSNTASPAATPGEQLKSTTSGGLFGSTTTTSAGGSGGLFGATASNSQPPWNFGAAAPNAGEQNKPASTQSTFASGATSSGNPTGQGLFGSTTPQANKTAQPSTTPAGNPPFSIFGNQANKQNENQQPATTRPQQSSGSIFSQPAAPASSAAPTFQFPSATRAQNASTPQPSGQSLFAPKTTAPSQSGAAAPAQNTTSNIFGGANQTPAAAPAASASTNTSSSLFSGLGQSQNAAASSGSAQPATSSTAGSKLFSGGFQFPSATSSSASAQPDTTTTAAPAPSFGGFSLGNQTTSSGTNQPATTSTALPTFSLNNQMTSSAAAPASNTAPATTAGGGLGGNLFTAAPSGNTGTSGSSAPSGTAATGLFSNTTTTTGAVPATSTSGPAPPQQSRLASKSMDEILTMWSTSLATHQKTFQQLAKRVSVWDRMLVENSSQISALYGRCFQAERDCSEVERQLSNVEHSQSELEALLERYEGEVDRMMEGAGLGDGGVGVSGVDAERERTYKTAEACSTRLTDMHHSLTDMIEEINAASSKLSSTNNSSQATRPDDPLAEIVRVLNGHLSQLQTIDNGATALQVKVVAAQREARGLGEATRGLSGPGEWVEGFGRSYLGRR